MAWFWGKKERKAAMNSGKSPEDEKNVRIDVEDLIDQDFSCEEIASQLGVSKERVYAIKEAKKRREARVNRGPVSETGGGRDDPIREMKIELEKLRLEREKIMLEHELQKLRDDLHGEEEDEEELVERIREAIKGDEDNSAENGFLQALAPLLPALLQKLGGGGAPAAPSPSPPTTPTPSPEGEASGLPPPQLTDEEVQRNAAFIMGKIPKMFKSTAKEQLKQFNDTDRLRMLRAMEAL